MQASGCMENTMQWPLPTLCQNHPFIDGNKRTALAAALVFLELNGIPILDPRGRLKNAMIRIASGKMSKADFAELFRKLPQPD